MTSGSDSTQPMDTPTLTEQDIRKRIWQELGRATQDRHHEWRTPVLATVGLDGTPNARTVVLRHADAAQTRLQIFTDSRSPKIKELAAQPAAMLSFWSKRLNWQLRVRVNMSIELSGPQVEAVWARVSQSAAAGDYLSASAPGDALNTGNKADLNSGTPREHHLAVLTAQVQDIDWLELARSGHRRALLGANNWQWLVP